MKSSDLSPAQAAAVSVRETVLRATAMDFDQLKNFIEKSMRMSHIHQPVMPMTLIVKGAKTTAREIAASTLIHDESQIESTSRSPR